MRPSTFPTRTNNRLTAVVHPLRNLHPWPPLHSEGDRRKRLARFCVEPPVSTTSCLPKQYCEALYFEIHAVASQPNHMTMVRTSKPSVASMVCLGERSGIGDEKHTTTTRCSGSGALSKALPCIQAPPPHVRTISSRRSFIDCRIRPAATSSPRRCPPNVPRTVLSRNTN